MTTCTLQMKNCTWPTTFAASKRISGSSTHWRSERNPYQAHAMTQPTDQDKEPTMLKRPISIDDLFKIKLLDDPQISPDGKTVAFVITTPDLENNTYASHLWLASRKGTTPPKQFTFGAG